MAHLQKQILDNVVTALTGLSTTSKHPKARAWPDRHKRFVFHFTPTSSSWLNAVEGFFAKLTRRRLKRSVFHSFVDLQAAGNCFVAETNENPSSSLCLVIEMPTKA